MQKELDILLIENKPGLAALFTEVIAVIGACRQLRHVCSATDAMEIFEAIENTEVPAPDLVILSLELESNSALALLDYRLQSTVLKSIPFNLFYSSGNDHLIPAAYQRRANCCVPLFSEFSKCVETIAHTWEYWSLTVCHQQREEKSQHLQFA